MNLIGDIEHDAQSLQLAVLRLGDLGVLDLEAGQLLDQVLYDEAVVEILQDVLHDDALLGELVVHPVHEQRHDVLDLRVLARLGRDHGTLLALLQLTLGRHQLHRHLDA